LCQHSAVGGKARPLEREDKSVRRFLAPTDEAFWSLRAVEGAIDLDRGQAAAGIFQLALLRQAGRIERAAPGLEGPTANADPDAAMLGDQRDAPHKKWEAYETGEPMVHAARPPR